MFRGRKLILATRHGKEKAIAPVLETEFGLRIEIPRDLDTDQLGTFTGEVERTNDPLTTARKKCLMVMNQPDADLALASEGSFGPHPAIMLLPANEELLVLLDRKNNIEIISKHLSTDTNFNGSPVRSEQELLSFALASRFPSHGLIIRPEPGSAVGIIKGITEEARLLEAFRETLSAYGRAYVETDMRAMFNPTRMGVIGAAARKLAEKMRSICPGCGTPGFSVTNVIPGLPCALCSSPTRSALGHVLTCNTCGYREELRFPNGRTTEDPTFCDHCNP
jgi:hypothetical protein